MAVLTSSLKSKCSLEKALFTNMNVMMNFRMAVKVAAGLAVVLSIFTLFGCLVFLPMLWNKVSSIQEMVGTDMDEFNVSHLQSYLSIGKVPAIMLQL